MSRLWWVAIPLAVLMLGAAYVFRPASVAEQITFFSQTLADHGVVETVFEEQTFVVDHGHISANLSLEKTLDILVLAYEKALARRTPLLALPGIDPQEFRAATEELSDVREHIAKLQRNPQDAAAIREGLYPIGLLHELASLEDARRAFLDQGSATSAIRYQEKQRAVIDAYENNLAAFERTFRAVVPTDIGQYAIETRIINRDGVLQLVQKMRNGIQNTAHALDKRARCVQGHLRMCSGEQLTLTAPAEVAQKHPTEEELTLARTIREAYLNIGSHFDEAWKWRTIALADSDCIAERVTGARLFSFRTFRDFGDLTERGPPSPISMGNVHFLSLKNDPKYKQLPFVGYFAERGQQYIPINPLIYYECADTAKDQGRIFSVRAVSDFVSHSSLSSYAGQEEKKRLQDLEQRLRSDLAMESDAIAYLRESAALAKKGVLPLTLSHALTDLVLLHTTGARGTLQVIRQISDVERINMIVKEKGVSMDMSALNMFFIRAALPALFLSNNPLAVGPVELPFAVNDLPAEKQPYDFYSSFASEKGAAHKLSDILMFYREVHAH